MSKAMSAIPKDGGEDGGYSTPDVYGRAAQFYLALEKAANNQPNRFANSFGNPAEQLSDDELTWRGFLTMIALRNILDLPLRWEQESFTLRNDDRLGSALAHPPQRRDQFLYPDEEEYLWDGEGKKNWNHRTLTFYVLTWAPNGTAQTDLAIYSPMTFLYPVADWRAIFSSISELEVEKFFDPAAHAFRNCVQSLQAGERKLVYFWLQAMIRHLNGETIEGKADHERRFYRGTNSTAKQTMQENLNRYIRDLEMEDESLRGTQPSGLEWKKFPEYNGVAFTGLPKPLSFTYDVPGPPLFADQICFFKVEQGDRNPFEPCDHSDKYKIEEQMDEYDLYAFLPIHPEWRKDCLSSGLAENMKMKVIPDPHGDAGKQYIHVSTNLNNLPGFPLERDYLIEPELTEKRKVAVCYQDRMVNMGSWPLIAVWPDVIGTGWKEYYVMRSEFQPENELRIYQETPLDEFASNLHEPVVRGSNAKAVKISYTPDAVPFVRKVRLPDGKETEVSVGMVTPRTSLTQQHGAWATVAVDFGTTSTRVFYCLENDSQIHELFLWQDKPLPVTAYEEKNDSQKCEELGRYFISPCPPAEGDNSLLSIFRRTQPVGKDEVPPILEGVIYHPENYSGQEERQDSDFDWADQRASSQERRRELKYLVTDLKWNAGTARPYYIAFMKQICIHVMSFLYRQKGVRSITWKYALPKAIEGVTGSKEGIINIWTGENGLKGFMDQVGGKVKANERTISSTITTPLTESVAASRFFAVYRPDAINKRKGYLVVDIGGGSTDIALWKSSDKEGVGPAELQWHTSLKVAGRDMFTKWVKQGLGDIQMDAGPYLALRNLIDKVSSNKGTAGEGETENALVDLVISSFGETLREIYKNQWLAGRPWAQNLCGRVTQAVTLLMFCLGYQIGTLMKNDLYQIKDRNEEAGYFSIAVTGRGSFMWNWLLNCTEETQCQFFKEGVREAAGAEWPDVAIKVVRDMQDPKATVGKGLLVDAVSNKNLDPSDGWNPIANLDKLNQGLEGKDQHGEKSYYSTAAQAFVDCYNRHFPNARINDRLHRDSLAGFIDHTPAGSNGATLNNVFDILMGGIYAYLSEY